MRAFLTTDEAADGFRWQIKAANGRIIGASTEAYKRRGAMLRNLREVTGIEYTPNQYSLHRAKIYLRRRGYDWYWPMRPIKR